MEIYLSSWILLPLPSWIIFFNIVWQTIRNCKWRWSVWSTRVEWKKQELHHQWDNWHCKIIDISLDATQIPLSIFTNLFHKRFEKHSLLESMLEILQQFYIQMETELHDFLLFPGDYSLCTLRCMRCGQPVTLYGSIGQTLLHAPTATLYHLDMIQFHDKQNHRELMLMPLLFTSYDNYLRSSKSFWVHLNWIEKFGCQKPTKYEQFMFYEARDISTTQYQPHSLSSLCYLKIYLKPSTYKRKNVVKRRIQNHPSHHWIIPIHVMDMTLTLISSMMMSTMHSKKNCW